MVAKGRTKVTASLTVIDKSDPGPIKLAPATQTPDPPAAPEVVWVDDEDSPDEDDGEPHCTGPLKGHCCWTPEGLCQFAVLGERVLCSLRIKLGSWEAVHADPKYLASPVGRHFAETFPGFGCGDFPQRIPAVMNDPAMGKCCWGR